MSIAGVQLVDRKLVHKNFSKNVLVANLRGELPVVISENVFNQILKESCDFRKYIECMYVPWNFGTIPGWNDGATSVSIARYLTDIIELDIAQYEEIISKIHKHDHELIDRCYCQYKKPDKYILRSDLGEIEYERLVRLLLSSQNLWSETEKYYFAKLLHAQKNSSETLQNFYALLYVDTTHEFFFEHSIEHVPANLLLEAVRQFVLAGSHVYFSVPLSDSQFVLKKFSSEFFCYLDLWYPILMRAHILADEQISPTHRKMEVEVQVAQRGVVAASFKLTGEVIRSEIFRRLRHHSAMQLQGHWFKLSPKIKHDFAWKGHNGEEVSTATIVAISSHGLQLHLAGTVSTPPTGGYDFSLYVENYGQFLGHGDITRFWSNQEGSYVELTYSEMSKLKLEAITSLIIQHGFILEEKVVA
ncbi:MAG: hypothetical protein JW841_15705 [Deltaproteobacteria bacterium]|nr:hypothetical protein [Deltaproteobacteria bacterium]